MITGLAIVMYAIYHLISGAACTITPIGILALGCCVLIDYCYILDDKKR